LQGRRGVDLNGQVSNRRRAPHRAGHECRGSISLAADFVYIPLPVNGLTLRLLGSFCARAVVLKWSFAAAATGARSIAPELAHRKLGAAPNAQPAALVDCMSWSASAAIAVAPITFATSSRTTARVPKQRPICVCVPCQLNRAQVDWGHFGSLAIGRAHRPLVAFVMVLSYSRRIFLRFFLNARMENFLRGHVGAFTEWRGIPRVLLYDNLKSAVLERHGDAIRFHPTLLEFAGHYRYEPRPVAIARGNEKGRVERAVRYVRDNFFAARNFADLEDLNRQAEAWCNGVAADRRCPDQNTQSVREAFAEEQPRLLNLPDTVFPLIERVEVSVGKTPYVRFDLNDYSIPHTHVRRALTVLADLDHVRIVDGSHVLVCHPRSYDKGAQIEVPTHIEALTQHKRAARVHRATNHLALAAPASKILLLRAAERGDNLGTITVTLTKLLERYGAAELQAAIIEALERDVPHPNAVRLALERRRELRNQPPPVALNLPAHVLAKDVVVQPHNLDIYDQLKEPSDDE
jgi:hypothetical protein